LDEKRGLARMNIYYKGILKGTINEEGEVLFKEDFMKELAPKLFRSLRQEEQENGDVALVEDEMGLELKISVLKEIGFTFDEPHNT
jgi:hypothetical protein